MFRLFLATSLVIGNIAPASAANLVQNGNFETGDFSGWSLSGNVEYTRVIDFEGLDETFAARVGPVGSAGVLAQTLVTAVGVSYEISFWLRNESDGTNRFEASFGDTSLLLDLRDQTAFPFRRYTFVRTASNESTALRFTYRNDPSYWYLDSVSVTPLAVPEPASWAMIIAGFGLIGAASRRRRTRAGQLGLGAAAC